MANEHQPNTEEYAQCAAKKAARHLSNLWNCSWGSWNDRAKLLSQAIRDDDNETGAMECVKWLVFGEFE